VTDDRDDQTTISRRGFVGSTLAAVVAAGGAKLEPAADARVGIAPPRGAQPQVPAFALDELTIEELQGRMQSGQDTAQSLTRLYLGRIDAIDSAVRRSTRSSSSTRMRLRSHACSMKSARRARRAGRCTAFRC
jgi:hypothetical protein